MKVSLLGPNKCAGHACCNAVDERLFPLDDFGYSVLEPYEVDPADEELVREGVDACPERALIIEDDE